MLVLIFVHFSMQLLIKFNVAFLFHSSGAYTPITTTSVTFILFKVQLWPRYERCRELAQRRDCRLTAPKPADAYSGIHPTCATVALAIESHPRLPNSDHACSHCTPSYQTRTQIYPRLPQQVPSLVNSPTYSSTGIGYHHAGIGYSV